MAKRKTKLQQCFEDFNEKYFDGRLHDVEVSWAKQPRVDGERVSAYCHCPPDLYKSNRLVLASFLRRKVWIWKLVLIHEMAHLNLHLNEVEDEGMHGPLFNAEMLRLANMGALNDLW